MIGDRELEEKLLGCLIEGSSAIEQLDLAGLILQAEDFSTAALRPVFSAVRKLSVQGQPIDPSLVACELPAKLTGLIETLATKGGSEPKIVAAYAGAMKDMRLRRELKTLCSHIIRRAEETDDGEKVLGELAEKVFELTIRKEDCFSTTLDEAERQAFRTAYKALSGDMTGVGYPSGFKALDGAVGALERGAMTVIAARPGMGKSALVLEILRRAALAGRPGILFSLEMGHEQLGLRAFAARTGAAMERLRKATCPKEEWARVMDIASRTSPNGKLLGFMTKPDVSISEVRAFAMQKRREVGDLAFIGVDYLQLMKSPERERQEQVASLSRGLKLLAMEMNCHVLALSQLNRGVESRDDKRPMLSDLRESGAIEQDADRVMFVYREEYYNGRRKGEADLILAKQRNGPTSTVTVGFSGETTSFFDLPDAA